MAVKLVALENSGLADFAQASFPITKQEGTLLTITGTDQGQSLELSVDLDLPHCIRIVSKLLNSSVDLVARLSPMFRYQLIEQVRNSHSAYINFGEGQYRSYDLGGGS